MRFPSALSPALALALSCACSDDSSSGMEVEDGGEVQGGASSEIAPAVSTQRAFERLESDAARELRRALDLGDHERARALHEELRPELGVEAVLLAARLAALESEDVEVLRLVEDARAAAPNDPRVFATAAELSASAGRLDTAATELRRGLEAIGLTPELLRAQGVIELCRPGGARRGLELIERARSYDEALPFTERARAQAHLLLAKRALSESRPRAALESAYRSLELDPEDADARVFLADCLASNQNFEVAVRVLEELVQDGFSRGSELALMYKRAALGALLEQRRDAALEYFRLARAAGLSDEDLGSGAQILADASVEAMQEGVRAFEAGDLETARVRFEHALRLDDDLLVVHNHLAVVLFQQEQYLPAATHWRRVLDTSSQEGLELPEPVHIFLAKALHAAEEVDDARAVLEAYLEREPEGDWVEATRALLGEL